MVFPLIIIREQHDGKNPSVVTGALNNGKTTTPRIKRTSVNCMLLPVISVFS
jgi:hypothetical protein